MIFEKGDVRIKYSWFNWNFFGTTVIDGKEVWYTNTTASFDKEEWYLEILNMFYLPTKKDE